MGLARRTWTAALAAAAIGGTGIGVAAASGPARDDVPVRPASSTSAPGLDDDGTADQGRGDRPAVPLPTGSASTTSGRHAGDDDGTADQGHGDRDGATSSPEPDDDRSGPGGGDDHDDANSGPGGGDDDRSGRGGDDSGDDD